MKMKKIVLFILFFALQILVTGLAYKCTAEQMPNGRIFEYSMKANNEEIRFNNMRTNFITKQEALKMYSKNRERITVTTGMITAISSVFQISDFDSRVSNKVLDIKLDDMYKNEYDLGDVELIILLKNGNNFKLYAYRR